MYPTYINAKVGERVRLYLDGIWYVPVVFTVTSMKVN